MAIIFIHWHISLLGGLRAEQNNQSLTRFRSQKTGALLAYLAYHMDRLHPRDILADMLWQEDAPDAARASLRTALNSLRKQLEPPGAPPQSILLADRSLVGLRREAVTTDIGLFHDALQEARRTSDPHTRAGYLARAVQVYHGELLPGFYDDWVLAGRRHLEEAYTGALRQLTAYAEGTGDLSQALDYALRVVTIDPVSEEAHVDVIRLFRRAGKPREALQQYDALAHILREQLDSDPAEESRSLAVSIRGTLARPVTVRRSHRHARPPALAGTSRSVQRQEPSLPRPSIPLPMMPFFGREQEIEHLVDLLQRGGRAFSTARNSPGNRLRLVTLLGPGGSGKTRLSIEVARQCQRAFADAVWFVALADLSDPQAIPDAILDAMELSRTVDAPWFAAVQAALGERPGLLILDNFEHLLEAGAGYVRDLLTHLPGLVCLATSRLRLDLDGERIVLVAPLPVPLKEQSAPEDLLEYSSIRLFLDRAQASRADFQLTSQNAAAVAELCRRLEGLPLALELAASWAQVLTPHQMLERTQNRLSLRTRRKRDDKGRHESLHTAVEWSYRLLSAELQLLFQRLSVFRGGWNLAAALAV
jgi:DNA-binding SARP family transcriptional activator